MDKGKLENGKVVPVKDIGEWAAAFQRHSRVVEQTEIGDVVVSTVFLGLNHGFGGTDKWFETMIFGGDRDGEQWRYETIEEAKAGHTEAVNLVNGASG